MYYHGRDYDQRVRSGRDVPFWIEVARSTGGPVLELACGTGRVAIPLAEAGFEVTGIDLSESMLRRARSKAKQTGATLHLIRADMRGFHLGRVFRTIICPLASFSHLITSEDVGLCLASVRRHMAEGARFGLDVFNPGASSSGEILRREDGVRESTTAARVRGRRTEQAMADGPAGLAWRTFAPEELKGLLGENGLVVDQLWGDYDRCPFERSSPKQIVIARLA